MEFIIGMTGFILGVIFGCAVSQKQIKIKCGTLEMEARNVRDLKAIAEIFKGENPLAKFKGPVQ